MPSYSPPGVLPICRRLPKSIYPFLMAILVIHSFWMYYDVAITSHQRFRPKREHVRVTESSPLSPYYPPSPGMEYVGYTRSFPIWTNPFPCGSLETVQAMKSRAPAKEGLFYIKLVESSASIFASVTARIARNVALRKHEGEARVCTSRLSSQRARRYFDRSPRKSFLWTMVREPVSRLVSKYYHYAHSKEGDKRPVSFSSFRNYVLNSEKQDYGYYYRALGVDRSLNPYRKELEIDTREVLESYDFIGISERRDESLAVLTIILDLQIQDVLYVLTPRERLAVDNGIDGTVHYFENWKKEECRPIIKPEVTQEMKEWFYSEQFEALIEPDVMLYKAVNASLDRTISELGRKRVEKTREKIRFAQEQVQKNCADVLFPCSPKGDFQKENDCLFFDVGCGFDCIDKMSQIFSKDPRFQKLSE